MNFPARLRIAAALLLGAVLAIPGAGLFAHFSLRSSPGASPTQDADSLVSQLHRGISLGKLVHNADPDAIQIPHGEGPAASVDGWEQTQRAFPARDVPANGYQRGMRQLMAMQTLQGRAQWQQLGPIFAPNASSQNPQNGASTAVSGRVTAIAVVPSTCADGVCGTIYAGAAYGGVWKTTDAGKTWTPLMDHQSSAAVGSITLDPKNPSIIYVGTGESTHAGDSHRGVGILRSTDGGRTWAVLGHSSFVNRAVGAIAIDPRTAGDTHATLFAVSTRAVSGGATTGGGAARTNPSLPGVGFYKSTDGGQTWSVSNPDGAFEGAQSLVMDPTNPDVMYVGFEPDPLAHAAKPDDTSFYAAEGIYKTTDAGATWTHLTQGLPSLYYDGIFLGLAPSNPSTLYAAYNMISSSKFNSAAGGDGHESLFKSTDSGATWTPLTSAPNVCGGQCDYDSPITVDPTDPNTVYIGGTANYSYWEGSDPTCGHTQDLPKSCHSTVAKTTDGGATWADVSENGTSGPLHPDDHVIVIAPNDHSIVYTGNDGGIFHSADAGKSWNDLNKGLGTLQFNGLTVGPNGDIFGGTQDNGTFEYTGSTTWKHVMAGDGGPTGVDPKNPKRIYKSYYGPFLIRNDFGGNPDKDVFIAPFAGDFLLQGLGQFYEPYKIAPSSPNTIFYGTYRIWRSKTGGGSDGNNDGDATNDSSDRDDWVPISFDLRCPAQPRISTATCSGVGPAGGRGIASIAIADHNPNVVAAGSSNGLVWLTTNAMASVKTDSDCRPWTNIRGVALCNYVKGPRWHQIDLQLPQRYPTEIKFAPGSTTTLYVTLSGFNANTQGHPGHVFVSFDQGKHWKNLNGTKKGLSLPDLPFNDIVVNPVNGHLYAAADYGGVYVSMDHGSTWRRLTRGLPAVPVYEMQYFAPKHTLVVATHGRGVWQIAAP